MTHIVTLQSKRAGIRPLKQLPPYGARLAIPRDNPTLYVSVGNWSRARNNTRTLVLPAGVHPALYRWPVLGLQVVVLDYQADSTITTALGVELAGAGATYAIVWRPPESMEMVVAMRTHP